jgi:uncharacterized membrane protein YoaK (UPF0700 family)
MPAQTKADEALAAPPGGSAAAISPPPSASPSKLNPTLDPIQERAEHLSTSTLLATAGGFLDGFTYVGHGHVFANAMTGNVVLLGVEAMEHSWRASLSHLWPILMFLLGIWAARALQQPVCRRLFANPYATVLAIEAAILLVLCSLPNHTPSFWISSPIAFAASMQVQTFRNVAGYTYNSTFTTGNLRMLSVGLFDWCFTGQRAKGRDMTKVFSIICLVFLLGAVAGGYTVSHFGNRALMIEIILLLITLARSHPLHKPGKPLVAPSTSNAGG